MERPCSAVMKNINEVEMDVDGSANFYLLSLPVARHTKDNLHGTRLYVRKLLPI